MQKEEREKVEEGKKGLLLLRKGEGDRRRKASSHRGERVFEGDVKEKRRSVLL